MANTSWKLVVTPLNAEAETREAVVHADNWLSALRLARKALGEEGGVPPGASCVMSASGEVTILDAVQRRRYLLTRAAASVPPPAAAEQEPPPAPSPPAANAGRKATIAYSPQEAAKLRAQAQALAPAKSGAAAQPAGATTGAVAPPQVAQPPGATQASASGQTPGAPPPAAQPPAAQPPAAQPPTAQPPTAARPLVAAPLTARTAAAQPVSAGPTPSIGSAETEPPPSAEARAPLGSPQGAQPARRATMAYSPEQVANARREAAAAAPRDPASPGAPAGRPDAGPPRKSTVAYSPAESAAVREQIAQAQAQAQAQVNALADTVPPPAEPAAAPVASGAPRGAPQPGPAVSRPNVGTSLPAPLTGGAKPLERRSTMAYSPEESAAVRAQLAQAQAAAASAPAQTPLRTTTQSYSPSEVAEARAQLRAAQEAQAAAAAPRKKATMAYVESPFIGGALLALGSRDQEPSGDSPLTYRERTYFAPEAVERTRLETLLHGELARIQGELAGHARGQYVSLAVFDHHFQGKPERPPIATLEWKDWRGVAVFWQASGASSGASTWSGAGEGPVRSMSFMPGALAPVAAPSVPPPAQSPAPLPSTGLAPSAAMFTPAPVSRGASESWPVSSAREGTGEQDRRLAVAFEAVQDLYFLGSAAEGLDFAVKLLAELVPSEATSGSVYDINTDEFRVVAATGPGADERRATALPSSVGLLAAAMLSHKETFVVADVTVEPRFVATVDGRAGIETRNLAYLPLAKGDVWLGVVQLINRRNPRGFSDGDLAVAAYVAGQVLEFLHAKRQAAPRRR